VGSLFGSKVNGLPPAEGRRVDREHAGCSEDCYRCEFNIGTEVTCRSLLEPQ